MRVYILIFSLLTSIHGKNATIQIFSDSLDWETILKSRTDYTYTSYNVQDDGLRSGKLRFSISAYDANQPSLVFEANTVLDIRNYRKDENGDGIYDILDPEISYQGTFTGTESGTYYLNSSYLGAVNFGTTFNVTRDVGQTYITARINAVVTSSSIQEIQVGTSYTVNRNYFSLGWSGYLEYGTNNYRADFSNNETGTAYSGSSQITKTNENSIALESFPLPDATGNTSNTDITLERKGNLYHKQLVSGGITYYIRILDTEDSDNDGIPDIGDPTPKSFFSSTQSIGNGWHQHYKFGTFFSFFDNAWCYHTTLGWIYVPNWTDTGTWIFKPDNNGGKFQSYKNLNWLWTTPQIYPHAFSNRLNEWLYIGSEQVFIWSKSSGQWSDFAGELQSEDSTAALDDSILLNGNYTVELNATVAMDMIWCPPGTFMMGQEGVEGVHQVTLTHGFYLGKYEVTQAQYEAVMIGNSEGLNAKPGNWQNNPNFPVKGVSWNDVQVFLSRLNDKEQTAGRLHAGWKYVLPTEAQWEYACRAGTTTIYSWGNDINSTRANYNRNIDQRVNVGQYSANPWGFFDMHGNVWEWTADAWGEYATGALTDPFNSGTSDLIPVLKGGSWKSSWMSLRSASRIGNPPSNHFIIGFRVGFQKSQ
jgi:formylglycine-generating enzyme required for sulfatase activity